MFARQDVEPPALDLAAYVRRLGAIVSATLRSRGLLLNELRRIDRQEPDALSRAGRIANQCGEALDDTVRRVASLPSLAEAQVCTQALRDWIVCHVQACDAVTLAAGTGDRQHLSRARARLREAHPYARQFNAARRALVQQLAAERPM